MSGLPPVFADSVPVVAAQGDVVMLSFSASVLMPIDNIIGPPRSETPVNSVTVASIALTRDAAMALAARLSKLLAETES